MAQSGNALVLGGHKDIPGLHRIAGSLSAWGLMLLPAKNTATGSSSCLASSSPLPIKLIGHRLDLTLSLLSENQYTLVFRFIYRTDSLGIFLAKGRRRDRL